AQLESGIDFTILVLHHNLGGRSVEPVLPWSLNRKIKYIRRVARMLKTYGEALEVFETGVSALMDEIERASEFRHDMLHGFALEYAEGSGEAKMSRFLRAADPTSVRTSALRRPKFSGKQCLQVI